MPQGTESSNLSASAIGTGYNGWVKLHPHLHLRKRTSKGLEPYPARSSWKRFLDTMVYGIGIIGPVMTIPQILLIYVGRNATGVAPESWLMWALFDIPWIVYGFVHRERPIVMTYTLWFICNAVVFVGALLY